MYKNIYMSTNKIKQSRRRGASLHITNKPEVVKT